MARLVSGVAVERTDAAKSGAGTLSLNGSSQVLVPFNKDRIGLYVSNPGATNKMWLGLGAAAAANAGIMVPPGQTIPITGFTGQVNIIGTAADTVAFAEI